MERNHEKAHRHYPSHAGRRHAVARWPEEDPRNGFTHGGWAMPFLDDALNQAIGVNVFSAGVLGSDPERRRLEDATLVNRFRVTRMLIFLNHVQ